MTKKTEITIDLDVITSELDALKLDKARYEFELKAIKDEIEKREMQLCALLGRMGVESMDYGVYSFGFKTTVRNALDQKLLKEKFPEQYDACYVAKENRKFEFKINK